MSRRTLTPGGPNLRGRATPATPASTSSSSRRNLSLGATFSMRAYLHRFVVSGQSGGYARNINSPGIMGRDLRSSLGRLVEKLAHLRASEAQPRIIRSRRRRPRRPGWVLDAVCRVLADQATGPMRVMTVHAAVEALVGETVSKDSISWVLSSHSAGPSPVFVRVSRGRYVLASAR